jgi:hypothetical protein
LWLGGASKKVVPAKRRGEGRERRLAATPALLCFKRKRENRERESREGERWRRKEQFQIFLLQQLEHDTWMDRWHGEVS